MHGVSDWVVDKSIKLWTEFSLKVKPFFIKFKPIFLLRPGRENLGSFCCSLGSLSTAAPKTNQLLRTLPPRSQYQELRQRYKINWLISYYGKVASRAELLRRIILLFPISHFLDKRGNKNFLQSLRSSFLFEVQQIQKNIFISKEEKNQRNIFFEIKQQRKEDLLIFLLLPLLVLISWSFEEAIQWKSYKSLQFSE